MNRRGVALLSAGFVLLLGTAIHSLLLILLVDFLEFPGVDSYTLNLNHLIDALFNVVGFILAVAGTYEILHDKAT
jgi:hypothetical protein